ncbi:hypothetical protein LWI29_022146 [Acer saccharum]|uniref:Uncharacterized protein n=1 Tax=Acer saccharum TaxID=4024 RepID=A0AA39SRZ2_ACESA|nr:hypothetical protein LWI29_022673 [Acer saccharum]KAK0597139.1 hypothetical protein LWI29_022146 [Acer saccharum]
MQTHMDLRFAQLEGRLDTRFDTIEANIEELPGGSGVEPQDFDQRTPILNFDDEQQMQDDTIDSNQGTEILQLSDEDGGD